MIRGGAGEKLLPSAGSARHCPMQRGSPASMDAFAANDSSNSRLALNAHSSAAFPAFNCAICRVAIQRE